MSPSAKSFRSEVKQVVAAWREGALPSRSTLLEAAACLDRKRRRLGEAGLWPNAPSMLTATLDDGLGQGLDIIEAYGTAMGLRVQRLGLMQSSEAIVAACQRQQPDFLGLTVLQFDSEEDLATIAARVPAATRIVAGGPLFSADPGLADRTGIFSGARHVTDFVACMLVDAKETCAGCHGSEQGDDA